MKASIQSWSALVACLALSMTAFGQCDIDFDFGDIVGVSPDPTLGEDFVDGMLDEPYLDVLHIQFSHSGGD